MLEVKDNKDKSVGINDVVYVPFVVKDINPEAGGGPNVTLESALGGNERISVSAHSNMLLSAGFKSEGPISDAVKEKIRNADNTEKLKLSQKDLTDQRGTTAQVNPPPHMVNSAILNAPHTPLNTTNPPHTQVIGQESLTSDATKLAMSSEDVKKAQENQTKFEESERTRLADEQKKTESANQATASAGRTTDAEAKKTAGVTGRMPDNPQHK